MTTATEIDRVPALDADLVVRALALALSQTLDDAGRSAFVVGLSGGIDSAAAIAARAAGDPARSTRSICPQRSPSESARIALEVADHPDRTGDYRRGIPRRGRPRHAGARGAGTHSPDADGDPLRPRGGPRRPRPRDQQQERDRAGLHDPVGRHARRLLGCRRSIQASRFSTSRARLACRPRSSSARHRRSCGMARRTRWSWAFPTSTRTSCCIITSKADAGRTTSPARGSTWTRSSGCSIGCGENAFKRRLPDPQADDPHGGARFPAPPSMARTGLIGQRHETPWRGFRWIIKSGRRSRCGSSRHSSSSSRSSFCSSVSR